MQELHPRLKAAAEMVPPGSTVADIGTDHAYLPAYLLLNGVCPRAIACDVGEKPLQNAAETVKIYHLDGKIDLRVSDGLEKVSPEEYDAATICGMGGTLIAEILEKAELPAGVRLILQPMTHAEDVRMWLCGHGFAIGREVCVADAGRVYCCMAAEKGNEPQKDEPGYWYFGALTGDTAEERAMVKKTYDRVRTRADALAEADRYPEEQALLRQVLTYYEQHYDNYRKRHL